ncbi:FecR family protein [Maribacter cobaltidurans]|uniref:Histidine kinase n=1 Tax=Maribacter cobaltidurans TaxID=1178778 RepID=A0A223V2I2_9FLAO|nr:FecR domain-containing protein [Maribacter cobaltidurans]ASV29340.1 histidine kinase [Maribacter cobaltidurans]GGD69857.1 anti-sigma factor [Maribacter cobaltidurans]
MQENYLAKWLNNELTEDELTEFKKSEEYATYQKIVDVTSGSEAPEFDMTKAWDNLQSRRAKETPKVITLSPFKAFLRVAAVIAVLLTGAYFYLNTQDETIRTQLAENREITLPDNSEIVLNAESKLSFNEKNWDSKRAINLEGEAYFKVAKGKKFTVTTTLGTVTVLGTQFNVENRNGFFEVTCYEGLVSVAYNGEEFKLPAGNSAVAINGSLSKSKVEINGQPSWINKESSFKSIPLKYVLAELQRQYNLEVTLEGIDENQLFTGTFSNTNLDLALKSISTPLQINYKFEGNKVLFYEESAP